MDQLGDLKGKIHEMRGELKVSGDQILCTFYHKTLSSLEILVLTRMTELTGLAFYMSEISNEDVRELSKVRGIQKLGFFSCRLVSEGVLDYIKYFESLEMVSFVDTSVPNDKLLRYGECHPRIQLRVGGLNRIRLGLKGQNPELHTRNFTGNQYDSNH